MTIYFAIIGRLHGDDEDQCHLYENTTEAGARQQFIDDLRADEGISGDEAMFGEDYTNVYITNTLRSDTPITEL